MNYNYCCIHKQRTHEKTFVFSHALLIIYMVSFSNFSVYFFWIKSTNSGAFPPIGVPFISQTGEQNYVELETMISSVSISSAMVKGVSSTMIPLSLQIWMMCILVIPGKI